jgi:hypothetical protein
LAKDEKDLIREIDELDSDIKALQNVEPGRWPDEDVAADKDKPENEQIELGRDAQPWEILEALGNTRVEVSIALEKVSSVLEYLNDEIRKLKGHRHDNSKSYGGRPET